MAASHQRTGKKRARQPEEVRVFRMQTKEVPRVSVTPLARFARAQEVAAGLNNKLLTAARDQRSEVEAEERAAAGGGCVAQQKPLRRSRANKRAVARVASRGFDAQPTSARRLLTAQGAPEDSDEVRLLCQRDPREPHSETLPHFAAHRTTRATTTSPWASLCRTRRRRRGSSCTCVPTHNKFAPRY